ncbi:DUF932 domain-containing protein [Methylobacterium sp. SI9]|uniref:DUF932 domain-containing protein n=1 Tax=Methylobacterium guangdongense TaxID=3138811 RepID=UPI00313E9DD2
MFHDVRTIQSARIARFGAGATIVRSDRALAESQIQNVAPSVFAESKHASRSERYTHIPTVEVLRGLAREGFHAFEVRQGGSRDADKRGFTKHLLRLRREGTALVGDSQREVILLNSHDGTSSYQLMSGLFRMVCSNGLVVAEGEAHAIRIPHKGDIVQQVIEGAYRVIDTGAEIDRRVAEMRRIDLRPAEQEAFAEAASALRFAGEASPVTPRQVNAPRRSADAGSDLWRTFNRAQENLTQGGLDYIHRNAETRAASRRSTRPVNGIDGNVTLNRALWVLSERMAELKAA